MTGMTDASAIRKPRTPYTLSSGSTTALLAAVAPILHVPTLALPAGSIAISRQAGFEITEGMSVSCPDMLHTCVCLPLLRRGRNVQQNIHAIGQPPCMLAFTTQSRLTNAGDYV